MSQPRHLFALTFCCLALAAAHAHAEEESFVLADTNAPHFMSLAPERNGTVVHIDGAHHGGLQAVPLRSDRAALNNGFMRIDRDLLRPLHSFAADRAAAEASISETQGVKVIRPGGHVVAMPVAGATGPATSADATISSLFDSDEPETDDFHAALGQPITTSIRHSWPLPLSVKQELSSGYGMRSDPFNGRQSLHGGIDISAPSGTPVLATAEGVVSEADTVVGFGKCVAVKHRDGTESYYNHLSEEKVHVGQHVMQGQQIGALGSSGRSTGPHLDYRLKKAGQTFDPMTALNMPAIVNQKLALR